MKAIQIADLQDLRVVDVEKPQPRAGEVLLKIHYVGFCGSDLNTYLGRNPMVRMPVIPGHEVGVCTIAETVGLSPSRNSGGTFHPCGKRCHDTLDLFLITTTILP